MEFYRMVGKVFRICLIVLKQYTNVTDGQTPHDGIDRAMHIASRGNNASPAITGWANERVYVKP